MLPKQLLKQMVDFNKTAFENSFNAMVTLQEQMEKMAGAYMDQMTGVSAETKKAVHEWTKMYKKGLEDFKKMMDDNYKKLDSFLAEGK
ncbi:MAG: hypothetical protein FJ139_09875 [Deltaproteobacteria bacterium]|nr:hypothetical protein [Deltaproteobacteria bacterium]